jgi:glycosyltransferase 2 family protein
VSRTRWLLTALSFAAAIGVSVYIIASSWPAGGAPFGLPWWGHLLALGAVALEVGSRAWKVQLGARAMRIPITYDAALHTSLGGDFGAAITPARSGAEPARFLVLAEAGVPTASVLLILFVEIFLETLTLAVVATVLALTLHGSSGMVRGVAGMVAGYSTFALGAGVIGTVLARRHASGPPPRWARLAGLHAGRWRAVQRALRQLRTSVGQLRYAHKGLMAFACLVSIVHVLARLAVLPLIVHSLGAEAPLAGLVLWPLALLYGGAAAPIPGGGGLIEIGFRAALGSRIPASVFGASLIWWRAYTFYIYVVLGALAAGNTVLRALRERAEGTDAEVADAT